MVHAFLLQYIYILIMMYDIRFRGDLYQQQTHSKQSEALCSELLQLQEAWMAQRSIQSSSKCPPCQLAAISFMSHSHRTQPRSGMECMMSIRTQLYGVPCSTSTPVPRARESVMRGSVRYAPRLAPGLAYHTHAARLLIFVSSVGDLLG